MASSLTISLVERFNPLQLAGPLLDKELRVSSRQRRLYLLRCGYIAVLMLFVLQAYVAGLHSRGTASAVVRASRMGEIAKAVMAGMAWFQFGASPLLAIVLLSGAIGGEVRQRTLDTLLVTPMTDWQIIMGKFFAKLLQVLTFLAISLPILAIVRVFGGVPWDYVVSSLCITLTATMFAGSLSLLLSVTSPRTRHVVSHVLAWIFIVWAGLWGGLAALAYAELVDQTTLDTVLLLTHPMVVMTRTTGTMLSGSGTVVWPWHCLVILGTTIVLLRLSIWRLRKIRWMSSLPQPHRRSRRPDACGEETSRLVSRWTLWRPKRGPIRGSPIVWKEMRKGMLSVRRHSRWDWVRSSILSIVVVACITVMIVGRLTSLGVVFLGGAALVVLMFTLGVTSASASAITEEKQSHTWPILLTTTLSNREIVRGKVLGSVARNLPLLALAAILGLLAMLCGPHLVLASAGVILFVIGWLIRLIGTVIFLVGVAARFGVSMKSASTAVVGTLGVYLGARMVFGLVFTVAMVPVAAGGSVGVVMALIVSAVVQAVIYGLLGIAAMNWAAAQLRRNAFV